MKKSNLVYLSVLAKDGSEVICYSFNNFDCLFRFAAPSRFIINLDTDIIHYDVSCFSHSDLKLLAAENEGNHVRINIYASDHSHVSANHFTKLIDEHCKNRSTALEITWPRRRSSQYTFRKGPVPFTGKMGHYSYFRSKIKTQQERRNAVMCDDEYPKYNFVRGRRSANNLPSPWDDIYRSNSHSWKKYRKHQWKPKPQPQEQMPQHPYDLD